MKSSFFTDKLKVLQFDTRAEMGAGAARDIARTVETCVEQRGECNIIFAAAPSQSDMLLSLQQYNTVTWEKVNAFHMDEYIGLNPSAPQRFGHFLKKSIFSKHPFHSVHYIQGWAENSEQECERYAELLKKNPPDIVCMGIGENGHIAFNDPHVADFHDPKMVKVVSLDWVCRRQQVHDGCFNSLDDVPLHAITLTIPALTAAHHIFCVVPSLTKAAAVQATCEAKIGEHCPATILRQHDHAVLYLDADSSSLIHSS